MITIVETGPLVTVQDRGRTGLAHLGVPRAGALDPPAAALANRLVGNDAATAVLEVLLGGLTIRSDTGCWVAVTGAPAPVTVDGTPRGHARPEWLPAGAVLRLGTPVAGVRSYVAVAGGIDVPPVLGSRSTDTLAWVGPPRVEAGTTLPVGPPGEPRPVDTPRTPRPGDLRLVPGPRDDWFAADALDVLCAAAWAVDADSNRVGLRLEGPALRRTRDTELASEGMVLGAVQVPPNGQPVVLLADHPPTGGYPVIGVVEADDLWQCAQLRPGDAVRFSLRPRPAPAAATR
ncbi:biotin-dependent carboxyltransferase family protein [Nocardioides hungaricus]